LKLQQANDQPRCLTFRPNLVAVGFKELHAGVGVALRSFWRLRWKCLSVNSILDGRLVVGFSHLL